MFSEIVRLAIEIVGDLCMDSEIIIMCNCNVYNI